MVSRVQMAQMKKTSVRATWRPSLHDYGLEKVVLNRFLHVVLLVFTVQKHPKARLNEQQGSSCLSASADSVFLLSLMSDRCGLGPGKYTDQLQSTACSNCPIGSYADTWLGRIFTQTSLQLFTHFCTFANTKNLLDSDFSANPKGFRL